MKSVEYMSAGEMRREISKLRELLAFAKCPDEDCDGQGFSVVPDGDGSAMQQQCQWCHERKELIGGGD